MAPLLLVTAAVVVGWMLLQGVRARQLRVDALPKRSLMALTLALALAAAFAQAPLAAARELANMLLLLALLVAATDELGSDVARVARLARLLGFVGGAAGFFAVLEAFAILPGTFALTGTRFFRATGGFGWPNELAMFLAISLPFAVYALRSARSRAAEVVALLAVGAVAAGLVATFSRGSWLATLAAPAVLLLVGRGRFVLRFWLAAAVTFVVVDAGSGGAVTNRIAGTLQDPLVGQRFALTQAGLLMFLARPLVGVGPGGFSESLDRFGIQVTGLYDFVGSAHNTYVHIAAETGVLGLIALVVLLGATALALLRTARRADADLLSATVLWSFTVACVVAVAEWVFAHGVGQIIMLVAAMGLAVASASRARA